MRIIPTLHPTHKYKLLHVSGYAQDLEGNGTFDALFSKTTITDNFKELFYKNEIQTYACVFSKTDTHFSVFNKCREFVIKNKIDFVFGFCYGSFPCLYSAIGSSVKGVILLDTSTTPPVWSDQGITANLTKPIPPIKLDSITCPVKLFYSEWGFNNKINTPNRLQTEFIKNLDVEVIPNSTHTIIVEPQRYILMNKIMEFINA